QILDAGCESVFASPTDKSSISDTLSQTPLNVFRGNRRPNRKAQELLRGMEIENNIRNPRPFRSIMDGGLKSFAGVLQVFDIPGGHAPTSEIGNKPEFGFITTPFPQRA
ncbi:hypothetical protein C8Q70DRAFT_1084798, partial [Cubamyces menziesii]